MTKIPTLHAHDLVVADADGRCSDNNIIIITHEYVTLLVGPSAYRYYLL